MLILGFNAYHGDVAAALLKDGRLVAAVEEERFRRIKHVAGLPVHAIKACLAIAGASPRDVDLFAVARGRRTHVARRALFALTHRGAAGLLRQQGASLRHQRDLPTALGAAIGLDAGRLRARLRDVEHHPAHLASAFFASPFEDAACCAIDGFGDFVSASTGHGRGTTLEVLDRVFFPHSIGLLYLAITQHLGFMSWGDEYKVMGLAPYGAPRFADAMRQLLRLEPDGRFALDLRYFAHWTGEVPMTWLDGAPTIGPVYTAALSELLGPPRDPADPIDRRHEDLAASIQRVFEEAMFHVLRGAHRRVPLERLCLAGGCAMNSVANGKIRTFTPFRHVFIQPAAADNGTALGAALYVAHHQQGTARQPAMDHAYWGTRSTDEEIRGAIARSGAVEARGCTWTTAGDDEELSARTARHLAASRIVGWFQGRMEWGARALGNRSILADPRRGDMRDIINSKIKLRERFRPFAPSVLEEAYGDWFVDAVPDPFMIQVYPVRAERRCLIPAVTHVDGSGRLHTVSRHANPRYWGLINAFAALTGVPLLLNTSFNENEPIVERPEQALDCFLRTDLDVLVLDRHILVKPGARVD